MTIDDRANVNAIVGDFKKYEDDLAAEKQEESRESC